VGPSRFIHYYEPTSEFVLKSTILTALRKG
jgi:hypothetical protein